jgi:hypothetical protein
LEVVAKGRWRAIAREEAGIGNFRTLTAPRVLGARIDEGLSERPKALLIRVE